MILVLLLIGSGTVLADDTVHNVTQDTWYATIQAAINAADPCDEIQVGAATYAETLNITTDWLKIIGADRATVIVDSTGKATNNAGIYVNADNVTLKSFTLQSTVTNSLPRYGIKFGEVDGCALEDVTAKSVYRSGIDVLGASNLTINNITSQDNGGHGLALTDCNGAAITDVTFSGNAWQNVSVVTWGRYSPLGTSGIVFSGTNSFGDLFQLEMGDYNNPGDPPAGDAIITYSTDIGDNADVTVQASDFVCALHGEQDDSPDQARIWFFSTLENAAYVADLADPCGLGHWTGNDMYIESLTDSTQLYATPGCSIQAAVDAADPCYTINVTAGTYTGAEVDKNVTIIGAAAGTSVINDGPHYGGGHPTAKTAFLLQAGSDGAQIRNFTVNNNVSNNFYFAIFARSIDDVIIDSLNVNDTIQGITNSGGSNWQITNNTLTDTVAAGGGGIAIMLSTSSGNLTCTGNLVENNTIDASATAVAYSCPAIALIADCRYIAATTENVSSNQVLGNNIQVNGSENSVGIEVGYIPYASDPNDSSFVHDNTLKGNVIDGAQFGIYVYNLSDLTMEHNTVENCTSYGMCMYNDISNITANYNQILGNAEYGIVNEGNANVVVNAEYNWWGHCTGPYNDPDNLDGQGDAVSDNVDFDPWLIYPFLTSDEADCSARADTNDDGCVNMEDFAELAAHWLEGCN